jgi:Rod binding domain-containing protein
MSIEVNRGITLPTGPKPKDLTIQKKIDDRQYIPKQFKQVAENMEQQFAEYMLNQMNNTVDENASEEATPGMDYYKGLKTTEQAKIMAQKNDLGLQNVILDQIYPKRLRNEFALKQYEAQADKIHHNLPKVEALKKNDNIIMGKNDSSSLESSDVKSASQVKEGGLK